MDRHLVAVEVRVEGRADQRVELDRLAIDQDRLEGLDPESMQRRCAVEQHRVLLDDLGENVPDLGMLLLDHLLRGFDGGHIAALLEFGIDERLEEFERHLARDSALMQAQFGPDHDD